MNNANKTQAQRLGVDIGKVIISADTDNPSRTIFGKEFLQTPEVEGAMSTIRSLHNRPRWSEIFLVSKCGVEIQQRTILWLEQHHFYERTGVKRENVYFCRERSEKAMIASRLLLTQFIDDKMDILRLMPPSVWGKILFAPDKKVEPSYDVTIAKSWDDIDDILTNDRWPRRVTGSTSHAIV